MRITYFPIDEKYAELEEFVEKQDKILWTAGEFDFEKDKDSWDKLNEEEVFFVKNVFAFFAISDGLVSSNIVKNYMNDIEIDEAQHFFAIQNYVETVIHGKTYSLMLEKTIKDIDNIFAHINTLAAVKKKKAWMEKWLDNRIPIKIRIIAFLCIEGIFFSGSFATMFWLKRRSLFPQTVRANELISRDENLHVEFYLTLIGVLGVSDGLDKGYIRELILEACDVEQTFIDESMSGDFQGLNKQDLLDHIKAVSVNIYCLVVKEEMKLETPLEWMRNFNVTTSQNFFEITTTNYSKSQHPNSYSLDVYV